MEITGKIIAVLPEVGGTSKAGNEWKKQEYVLETQEQYPKKVCFQIFGADRIAQANIQAGETVIVSFDIESREYQGRWFTNINAWKVDRPVAGASIDPHMTTPPDFVPSGAPVATPPAAPPMDNPIDDLPF
ncbi:hypothetical protein M2480_000973 [Parabacteroides sp. PFB2-12]|uniref:DUF3127 domain-containing protein n=1 Tax=unclassified Parabacteroides TaxID=2649774 RepID=UPI002476E839|nr:MULTISPECIES: DUF3127 domain-containing protein [unclassified Parabacteroides]MDH6341570.1 hypothetical protein [Parabacteroides sp. PM6-13]MDH6390007.1 hypothetical protein [Parabacteroides sp. PFB2-12]MDL2309658.1 DUF3127 domain-containing protein [Parabacteroides sp. OttesenSCG-928-B22]